MYIISARYPKSLRVRTWLAIRSTQEGKKSEAEQIYREILSENPPAAWKGLIFKQLSALKDKPDTMAAAAKTPAGGPSSAMTAEVKQAPPIDALVEKLAARLKRDGSDLTGWLMLIRSYAMLQQPEKIQEAAASARKQFASDEQALKQIDAVMSSAEKPAPEEEAKAPAEAPAAGGQAAMIRGMVERLATRLKENGADLDGWLRLIRSYSVLKDTGKAQEAIASARKQFASDPASLERIDSLVRDVGISVPEAGTKAPAEAPAAGGQAAMIRGMVERLATRLKENGADLDGWLRLIRSYTVLNETAKGQEAVSAARKQFASEPQKLEEIEKLTRELGLPAGDGKGEQPKQ